MGSETATRDRPIIFGTPMVRALLEGRKTQTRRVVKGPSGGISTVAKFCAKGVAYPDLYAWVDGHPDDIETWGVVGEPMRCPYGAPGDRLWVRESAYIAPPNFGEPSDANATDYEGRPRLVGYAASMNAEAVRCATDYGVRLTPSIYMPRWASRITLEITGVRVERLQEITEEDAFREGFDCRGYYCDPEIGHVDCGGVGRFRKLWDEINGKKYPWESDPWVWVISFRRLTPEAVR